MSKYSLNINGKQLTVELLEKKGQQLKFKITQSIYDVSIASLMKDVASEAPSQTARASTISKEIYSPMPGVIVKVSVKPGQKVHTGQQLLTMEAMKMENAVNAPCDAKIADIHVKAGQEVKNKQILITLL